MLENMVQSLKNRQVNIIGHEESFKSAVLLPLVKYESQLCVLFEKRASHLDHQPGEICFPGGAEEPDDGSSEQTAIRETCEELGLKPKNIKVIAPLDIMVSPFNMIITPFLAQIDEFSQIKINRNEVEEIFCVPLDYLLKYRPQVYDISISPRLSDNFPFDMIPKGKGYPFRQGKYAQFFYTWNGRIIWGLTARILNHFLNILKLDK